MCHINSITRNIPINKFRNLINLLIVVFIEKQRKLENKYSQLITIEFLCPFVLFSLPLTIRISINQLLSLIQT